MMKSWAGPSPTLTIDDAANGGSDDGAWHTAIAHTPALRAQLPDEFPTVARAAPSNKCAENK